VLNDGDDGEMLRMVEDDIENLRSAWRHALSAQNEDAVLSMAGLLWMVHEIQGWVAPAVELFDEALDAFAEDSTEDAVLSARALSAAAQAWFVALQGEAEQGLAAADAAAVTLGATGDADARYLALLSRLINVVYLYRLDDWVAVTEEGIAMGEAEDRPYWVAVSKQWRGGAAITAGDLETADRLLLEAKEIYEKLGSRYWMAGNFNHRAQVAFGEGRIDDAIDLFARSVEQGRDFGAVRIMLLSLNGLGEANLVAGNVEAAEAAFLESLVTAEQMGTVREMLNLIAKIAQIRVTTGEPEKAVELLATVVNDPNSAYPALFQSVPMAEAATTVLEELEGQLDADTYAAAYEAGAEKYYAVTVKELLAAR
jgi:tetratricopeptide (TPR) repeat protein